MGRYYRLSKKITDAESQEILKEMKVLEDVEKVEITKEYSYMKVLSKDDEFTDVMGKAVNIRGRTVGDLKLSFSRFAFEV